jgi:hypothetical protein
VIGRRVDETYQSQLANVRQPTKLWSVDQLPYARRERDVDLGRNPNEVTTRPQGGDFGDFANRRH